MRLTSKEAIETHIKLIIKLKLKMKIQKDY
jgi:hypothetical protein